MGRVLKRLYGCGDVLDYLYYFCSKIFLMKTIQRICILGLLAVFLFGITGLSVFHHTCSSSNRDQVAVYTGIFGEAPGSCCGDEVSAAVTLHVPATAQNIDEPPCCKSTTTFLTLHIISETGSKLILKDVACFPVPYPIALNGCMVKNKLPEISINLHPPPFPLAGRPLVYFLHQIRIPAHPLAA